MRGAAGREARRGDAVTGRAHQQEDLLMRRVIGSVPLVLSMLALALLVTGCPKRPGTSQASAPPPSGGCCGGHGKDVRWLVKKVVVVEKS